jgi:isochorismate synthase
MAIIANGIAAIPQEHSMTSHLPTHLFFAPSVVEHLLRYHSGDCVFVSPRQAIMAGGVALEREVPASGDLARQARDLLMQAREQGWHRAILLSAIPFTPEGTARLVIPRYVEAMPRTSQTGCAPLIESSGRRPARLLGMKPCPQSYQRLVQRAVQQIQRGVLDKVVLSRSLQVEAQVHLPTLLATLAERNPHGYTFAFDHQCQGHTRTLVGASPELLLAKCGNQVVSNPLAGSLPRTQDVAENQRRADYLRHSAKDRHEHALVVDAVASALGLFCRNLQVPAEPSVLETPTMLHLSTEIRGELKDASTSSLELALALHPTPAVCGHPTAAARDFIRRQEGFDRDLFTGLVGWSGADGNGEWAVTIRCADIGSDDVTLYAGAGIVAGSQPERELAETSAKMRTMLAAMGIESVMEAAHE